MNIAISSVIMVKSIFCSLLFWTSTLKPPLLQLRVSLNGSITWLLFVHDNHKHSNFFQLWPLFNVIAAKYNHHNSHNSIYENIQTTNIAIIYVIMVGSIFCSLLFWNINMKTSIITAKGESR